MSEFLIYSLFIYTIGTAITYPRIQNSIKDEIEIQEVPNLIANPKSDDHFEGPEDAFTEVEGVEILNSSEINLRNFIFLFIFSFFEDEVLTIFK
ncbi:CLUMA_CG002389, isoform A [Clunio marinus]|uniref:CLUMA_CG002389, isoform A n=1 Tax=Clunio marinus TaxID=568069 RepID=A0A1J1HQT7_9DIPT|nr:CLUMA_CG002389, isoform A [Clunio marinus]